MIEAIALHKANTSMIRVEELADKATNKNDRLRTFLIESFHIAALHSAYIEKLIAVGEWQRQCLEYVTRPSAEGTK